ncbi:hypothetical protein G647_05478 [Cladophialophora carrionii CBS 160.54]|uniref:FAD dependent oxidoreductase domain-containing protein n=1 Tax=Cladophialophora carrionii CBS 160.54 TaxID=1279043 RepID=V9DA07_9EURO|nr:uncharacterized protein G647_05478 [Cladophialophora carrionii CBS 160.54]ETI23675.1 hypothetical protein G647_05478 [Cladophialophora carrionii CBS 160.54]
MADSERKNIVVVGGGIIGCTTAYFLTRHPKYNPDLHSIHLLEATGIASGASGKAGGLLALWAYPQALVPLSFKLHADLAKEHDGARRWGYRGVGVGQIELKGRPLTGHENVIAQRGVVDRGEADASDPSGQATGKGDAIRGIHRADVASDENVNPDPNPDSDRSRVSLQKRSQASYANMRKAGLPDDLDWVAEECALAYESMGSPKDTAQVHPYQFTTSMAALAEERGARIVVGASVDSIEPADSGHVVHYTRSGTSTGTGSEAEAQSLHATDVIITAGPWTRTVWPGTPISALRAHSVTIRPSRPVSAYCLFTSLSLPKKFKPAGGGDGKMKSRVSHVTPEIYARPNNEIYACGEGDHLVGLPRSTADVEVDDSRCQDIVDYCASFSDEMRDGHVLVRQACYLPQVERGGGPLVGRTNTKGVFIAAGHTCWGIQNGPATGKLVSEFVFDGKAGSADVGALDPRRVMR